MSERSQTKKLASYIDVMTNPKYHLFVSDNVITSMRVKVT